MSEDDLFDLNPRDLSDTLVPVYEREWKQEVIKFKRKRQVEVVAVGEVLRKCPSVPTFTSALVHSVSNFMYFTGVFHHHLTFFVMFAYV